MTKPIKKLILIIIIVLAFMMLACSTAGDAAIKAIPANPTEPAVLIRQATDVPWTPPESTP